MILVKAQIGDPSVASGGSCLFLLKIPYSSLAQLLAHGMFSVIVSGRKHRKLKPDIFLEKKKNLPPVSPVDIARNSSKFHGLIYFLSLSFDFVKYFCVSLMDRLFFLADQSDKIDRCGISKFYWE